MNRMVVDIMKQSASASILVIEDDPQQIRLYSKALRGYRLTCVSNGTAALNFLRENHPDLIILDNVLSNGEQGIDFLPRFKDLVAHVPVIIISGTLDIPRQLQVLQGPRAAHYVIEKPVDLDELEEKVRVALAECGLGETVRALQSLERAEKIESNEPERRFTERLARQHDMVNRLRGSADRPNVSQFSRDYGVSRKTILRDLHDLIQRGQLEAALYPEWASVPAED